MIILTNANAAAIHFTVNDGMFMMRRRNQCTAPHKASQNGVGAVVIIGLGNKSVTDWLPAASIYGVHGFYLPRYRPVKPIYRRARVKALPYTK